MLVVVAASAEAFTAAQGDREKAPIKMASLRHRWRARGPHRRHRLAHAMLAPLRAAAIKVMHKGG
jgi:hypothetical protein